MVTLGSLWLPILLAGIAAFFVQAMMWMVLPHHKSDFAPIPDEDSFLRQLRSWSPERGMYFFPRAQSPTHAKDPDAQAALAAGPFGYLTIKQGRENMGTAMAMGFVHNLAISYLVAYMAAIALPAAAPYVDVLRFTATGFALAFAGSVFTRSIWMGHPWSATWKDVFDAVVIAVICGGIFAWLWP